MSEHAISNAKGWLETICEMVAAINAAPQAPEADDGGAAYEAAQNALYEAPLSILVRDGWHSPGQAHDAVGEAVEYEILLSTGGPALRIYGGLKFDQPDDDPQLQWQDWGTPWTAYPLNQAEREAVATFARQFDFGEG
jgi:hypothetical protein